MTKSIRAVVGDEPIIFILTANNWTDEEDTEALKIGVDGFLTKPFHATTMLEDFKKAKKRKARLLEESLYEDVDLSGCTILLAEDVAINAEIITQILSIENISVEHAENGALAVELFSKAPAHHFDAIIMDVRMPIMDGLSAAKAIRELGTEDAKTIPIIAMTANAFDEDVQHSLDAGMNAHLAKPVNPEQLKKTLMHLIALRKKDTCHSEGQKKEK